MFFKPNFCCNCGEKIKRAEWKILTSRRFCDVCEVEHKEHEWLPRAVVIASVLVGVFGIGSYLKSADQAHVAPLKGRLSDDAVQKLAVGAKPPASIKQAEPVSPDREIKAANVAADLPVRASLTRDRISPNSASGEPVFHCGAMTKKGKPCSRRIKTKGERCWQHVGQPSALVSESRSDVY